MNLPGIIKRKTQPLTAEKENIAGQGLCFLLGLCFSQARLFGHTSPFAVAAAAAVPKNYILAQLAGACLGYLLRFDGTWSARQIAALAAVSAVNYMLSGSGFKKLSLWAKPLNAGLIMLLSGFTVLFAQGFDADGFMICLCEAAMSFGAVAFLSEAAAAKGLIIKKEPLPQKQLVAMLVSVCALLMSLGGLGFYGISPARIAAAFAVLGVSKLLGAGGGSVCGSSMGLAMGLVSHFAFLPGAYTFAGLTSGLAAPLGKLAQATAFAVCNGVTVLMNTGEANMLPLLYETAIATTAFVLVPQPFFDSISVFFMGRQRLPELDMMKDKLLLNFKSVEHGLNDVADAIQQIAESLCKFDGEKEDVLSGEIRCLVRDQFSTLAMAVNDVSARLCAQTKFDTAVAARVNGVLGSYGIQANKVICSQTDGVERIEVCAKRIRGKFSRAALMAELEAACGYKLNSPTVKEEGEETLLTFVKKPAVNLRIGKAQFTANDGRLCGDSCDLFLDKDGNQIIIISDGMGTGPRAAVDGAVAAWLFSKLLIAGLNFDSSLRLSNSALIVKSGDESLATIDAARINLHTGQLELYKAGAGNSFVCKGKKVYKYGGASMPLGILREIEFDRQQTTVGKGDVLLMMSDGVSPAAYSLVADELRSFNKKDPSALAERVVEIAKRTSGGHSDDITVIAVVVG